MKGILDCLELDPSPVTTEFLHSRQFKPIGPYLGVTIGPNFSLVWHPAEGFLIMTTYNQMRLPQKTIGEAEILFKAFGIL